MRTLCSGLARVCVLFLLRSLTFQASLHPRKIWLSLVSLPHVEWLSLAQGCLPATLPSSVHDDISLAGPAC